MRSRRGSALLLHHMVIVMSSGNARAWRPSADGAVKLPESLARRLAAEKAGEEIEPALRSLRNREHRSESGSSSPPSLRHRQRRDGTRREQLGRLVAVTGWNFACPDWEQRLREGRSLVPDLPLFKDKADRAVRIFDKLCVPDIEGQPSFAIAAAEWFRDIVRVIFGSLDDEGVRHVPEVFRLVGAVCAQRPGGAHRGIAHAPVAVRVSGGDADRSVEAVGRSAALADGNAEPRSIASPRQMIAGYRAAKEKGEEESGAGLPSL